MAFWNPLRRQKEVKEIFVSHYGQYFDPQVEFEKRIDVRPDTLIYNHREDPYVFDQMKEKVPLYFTVYFDDVYICGFGEDQKQAEIDHAFWKGMRDAYSADKIRLNKGLAKQIREEREQAIKMAKLEADKKVDSLPDYTPTQKLAKEAIRRVKNAKNGKSSTPTK